MALQKDDRIRVVGEDFGPYNGHTGTIKGTVDEYIYERYGEGPQAAILKYYYRGLDAVVVLDYDDRDILIRNDTANLLLDEEEVQELEEMFNGLSGDQESAK